MGRNKNKEIGAALFKKIAQLLPVVVASTKGGRPRVSEEMALSGIPFVLRTGLPLGRTAPGTGLRQRHDLLAASA